MSNRWLNCIATPFLYKTIKVPTFKTQLSLFLGLLKNPRLAHMVRNVSVDAHLGLVDKFDGRTKEFFQALQNELDANGRIDRGYHRFIHSFPYLKKLPESGKVQRPHQPTDLDRIVMRAPPDDDV
jgi:hypothetical protein